ncbi:hypothetical protein PR048_021404, partial [Dryococelus australis]
MPLVGGFSRGSCTAFPPALSFRRCSILTSFNPYWLSRPRRAAPECKSGENLEILEKTHRPAASSDTEETTRDSNKEPRWLSGFTARLPPWRTGFDHRPGNSRIFAYRNRAGCCCWSAGFLGVLPFPSPFHSGAAPYLPQSPHLFTSLSSSLFQTILGILDFGSLGGVASGLGGRSFSLFVCIRCRRSISPDASRSSLGVALRSKQAVQSGSTPSSWQIVRSSWQIVRSSWQIVRSSWQIVRSSGGSEVSVQCNYRSTSRTCCRQPVKLTRQFGRVLNCEPAGAPKFQGTSRGLSASRRIFLHLLQLGTSGSNFDVPSTFPVDREIYKYGKFPRLQEGVVLPLLRDEVSNWNCDTLCTSNPASKSGFTSAILMLSSVLQLAVVQPRHIPPPTRNGETRDIRGKYDPWKTRNVKQWKIEIRMVGPEIKHRSSRTGNETFSFASTLALIAILLHFLELAESVKLVENITCSQIVDKAYNANKPINSQWMRKYDSIRAEVWFTRGTDGYTFKNGSSPGEIKHTSRGSRGVVAVRLIAPPIMANRVRSPAKSLGFSQVRYVAVVALADGFRGIFSPPPPNPLPIIGILSLLHLHLVSSSPALQDPVFSTQIVHPEMGHESSHDVGKVKSPRGIDQLCSSADRMKLKNSS